MKSIGGNQNFDRFTACLFSYDISRISDIFECGGRSCFHQNSVFCNPMSNKIVIACLCLCAIFIRTLSACHNNKGAWMRIEVCQCRVQAVGQCGRRSCAVESCSQNNNIVHLLGWRC